MPVCLTAWSPALSRPLRFAPTAVAAYHVRAGRIISTGLQRGRKPGPNADDQDAENRESEIASCNHRSILPSCSLASSNGQKAVGGDGGRGGDVAPIDECVSGQQSLCYTDTDSVHGSHLPSVAKLPNARKRRVLTASRRIEHLQIPPSVRVVSLLVNSSVVESCRAEGCWWVRLSALESAGRTPNLAKPSN